MVCGLIASPVGMCRAEDGVEGEVYIFTGHREPALDGLHLLYSHDGYAWDSIPGVWLVPEIGNKDTEYFNTHSGAVEKAKFAPSSMMRDPSIAQGPDGRFHLVWTLAWAGEKGFGYASSENLIDWSGQRIIPVMEGAETDNVWAPELFWDDTRGRFMIVWSSSIPEREYTAADTLGQNVCHRLFYTTTEDFETFAPARPFYDPGFNSIDGFVAKTGMGEYTLIVKDNRKPGFSDLFCVTATDPEGPYGEPSVKFAPTYSEGACAVKVGDKWLIYFDVYREGRFGAVETTDFKSFTPVDNLILVPSGHKHGTIIRVKESVLDALKDEARRRYGER